MYLGMCRDGLYYKVDKSAFDWATYVSPFTLEIWLSLLLLMSVCAISLCLTNTLEEDHCFDLGLSSLTVAQALMGQGSTQEPKNLSKRIIFLTVFIVGLVTCTAYSASLTSFLAVKHEVFPFTDYETLLYDTNYNVVSVSGSAYIDVFQVSWAVF